eukprot:CAMPEP_0174702476 /NCGR_PEP_ID=MMETSP1094-20130205/6748_1 /TAXON_ID=156173 /ORGANISM="Chrysochromulina brevifilum, Strain UTEX LB 985" /LENGTH=52 /DNA_ID=CAMNT_0015900253 /DNA_START=170 /DNA_END=324 /DNA_ORIENTATION=+
MGEADAAEEEGEDTGEVKGVGDSIGDVRCGDHKRYLQMNLASRVVCHVWYVT